MKSIEEFTQQKNNILDLYEEIKNSDYLPVEFGDIQINKNTVNEYIKSLKDERFVISVCGQMNVGKSTFLNNYIFENEILPSSVTAETAKLTEINYGEKERCVVHFYSMQEWQDLKSHNFINDDGETINYFSDYVKPAMDKYMEKTREIIYPEIILANGKKELDSLSNLRDYVGAEGKYTPFTKLLQIYYPSEKINGVTIVDTPGTNDPNKIRSKVTEEWIGKSDAVVFLMYAGKALSNTDVNFVNKFLLPVPSEKILIGLSKVDTIDGDYTKPKEYVKNALKNLSFAKTIENNEVYSIAPMFSYYPKLRKKQANGKIILSEELIDDINYQLDDRAREEVKVAELIEKDGLVKEFELAIQKTLIDNKGDGIIKSHTEKIKSIFDYAIMSLISEHDLLAQEIALFDKSDEEIKKESVKLANENMDLMLFESNISKEYKNSETEVLIKIDDLILNGRKTILYDLEKNINQNDLNHLFSNFSYDARTQVEDFLRSDTFISSLRECFYDLDQSMKDMKNELRIKIENSGLFSPLFMSNIFSIIHVSAPIEKINSKIKEQFLNKMELYVVSKWLFFTNEPATKLKLASSVKAFFIDGNFKNIILDEVKNNIAERNLSFNNDIIKPLQNQLEEMQKNIRSINGKKKDLSNNISTSKNKLEQINNKIKKIEQKKSDLLSKV